MFPITLSLPDDVINNLMKPVIGEGGYQSFISELQTQISGNTIEIKTASQAEKIIRYSEEYGKGGFEDRLLPISDELKKSSI